MVVGNQFIAYEGGNTTLMCSEMYKLRGKKKLKEEKLYAMVLGVIHLNLIKFSE